LSVRLQNTRRSAGGLHSGFVPGMAQL